VPKKRPVSEYLGGAQRKAAIIKAAVRLFANRGYRDASLASVAEAADLTLPGLLHHFPSKADLLFAVLSRGEQQDKALAAEAIREHPDDVARLLETLVRQNASAREDTLLRTVIAAEATSPEHPAHEFVTARYVRVRNALRRSIAKQSAPAGLSDEQVRSLAVISMAVMDGLQVQWLLDPEIDMVENFRVFGELLRRAIADPAE